MKEEKENEQYSSTSGLETASAALEIQRGLFLVP